MQAAIALGGTITGEHGVGRTKKAALPDQLGPDVMALTRRVKDALDPDGHPQPRRDPVSPRPGGVTSARMIRERHLFGPGPSNPYPEATRALAEPLLGPPRPGVPPVMDETCDMLRTAWGTTNARTLPLCATGSAGMEAAFVNTVHPGDVVVVAVNGLFGQRMMRRRGPLRRRGGRRSSTSGASRSTSTGCSPRTRRPAIIAAVHAETSTGVRSDIAALGAGKGDALLLVDAVTSIGGIELRADDWGDRRRLRRHPEVPRRRARPGAVHDQRPRLRAPGREAAVVVPRPRPARRLRRRGRPARAARTYHHTAPTAMVASLHGGLTRILEEGLEKVWARHEAAGALLQDGLEEMGLELFAAEGPPAARADHGRVPDGVDSAAVRR